MTRPIPRVVLALSVLVGIALTFAGARAAQHADELTGLYAVADESDGNIGVLFEVTSEHGKLQAYGVADDDVNGDGSCGRVPLSSADDRVAPTRQLDQATMSKWLRQPVAANIQAITLGHLGVFFHAPKGWRMNRDFTTSTGYFVIFSADPGEPEDFQKLDIKSVCPRGGPRWPRRADGLGASE
jgi:hypothetical protein